MDTTISSLTPYMIRALHEWMIDNDLTPHIAVNESHPDLIAPKNISNNGVILFNIGYSAVNMLSMDNEVISFSARFDGKSVDVVVPINAITSIHSRENGLGMDFLPVQDDSQKTDKSDDTTPQKKKPTLRIV